MNLCSSIITISLKKKVFSRLISFWVVLFASTAYVHGMDNFESVIRQSISCLQAQRLQIQNIRQQIYSCPAIYQQFQPLHASMDEVIQNQQQLISEVEQINQYCNLSEIGIAQWLISILDNIRSDVRELLYQLRQAIGNYCQYDEFDRA